MDESFPKLVVFDLDFTFWNAGGVWIDCTRPPFQRESESGIVTDSDGKVIAPYPGVPDMLELLSGAGCLIAAASRTEQPSWAIQVLELLGMRGLFDYEEIFPDSKVTHFSNLKRATRLPYSEMLFFDDERRNIIEVAELGVASILVEDGMTPERLATGLDEWRAGQNA